MMAKEEMSEIIKKLLSSKSIEEVSRVTGSPLVNRLRETQLSGDSNSFFVPRPDSGFQATRPKGSVDLLSPEGEVLMRDDEAVKMGIDYGKIEITTVWHSVGCGGTGLIECFCAGDFCACLMQGTGRCEGCQDCLDI